MATFRINDRVGLSEAMAHVLDVETPGLPYGVGYVTEVAESTGVPVLGTMYRVRWYHAEMGQRSIFREGELVPATEAVLRESPSARVLREHAARTVHDDTFSPVDAALGFMAVYDEQRPAFADADDRDSLDSDPLRYGDA